MTTLTAGQVVRPQAVLGYHEVARMNHCRWASKLGMRLCDVQLLELRLNSMEANAYSDEGVEPKLVDNSKQS